jgi:hypothetical protein
MVGGGKSKSSSDFLEEFFKRASLFHSIPWNWDSVNKCLEFKKSGGLRLYRLYAVIQALHSLYVILSFTHVVTSPEDPRRAPNLMEHFYAAVSCLIGMGFALDNTFNGQNLLLVTNQYFRYIQVHDPELVQIKVPRSLKIICRFVKYVVPCISTGTVVKLMKHPEKPQFISAVLPLSWRIGPNKLHLLPLGIFEGLAYLFRLNCIFSGFCLIITGQRLVALKLQYLW